MEESIEDQRIKMEHFIIILMILGSIYSGTTTGEFNFHDKTLSPEPQRITISGSDSST